MIIIVAGPFDQAAHGAFAFFARAAAHHGRLSEDIEHDNRVQIVGEELNVMRYYNI